MSLSENVKIELNKAASSAATSQVLGTTIDMQGYEGCLILTTIGTANAGNYLKAYQDDATDPSEGESKDVEGSKVVAESNGDTVYLDIYKPLYRYIRPTVVREASTTVGEIWVIKYGPRTKPVTNVETNVVAGEIKTSPAKGTA